MDQKLKQEVYEKYRDKIIELISELSIEHGKDFGKLLDGNIVVTGTSKIVDSCTQLFGLEDLHGNSYLYDLICSKYDDQINEILY